MPGNEPTTMQDKYGMTWNVHGPTKAGNYSASLTQPVYGSEPGRDLVSASSVKLLLDEMNAYADDYLRSGGKPPARVSTTVTARGGSGWAVLLVLVALALVDGKRGRR